MTFCSIGIISPCDCASTNYDGSAANTTPLASRSATYQVGDAAALVAVRTYDNVSLVCGNADGTFCARSVSFTDENGNMVTPEWLSYDAASTSLRIYTTDPLHVGTYTYNVVITLANGLVKTSTFTLTIVDAGLVQKFFEASYGPTTFPVEIPTQSNSYRKGHRQARGL